MFVVSVISERNGKTYFNKAGVGFRNKDGSINFRLDLLPETQLHIREAQSDAEEPPKTEAPQGRPRNGR